MFARTVFPPNGSVNSLPRINDQRRQAVYSEASTLPHAAFAGLSLLLAEIIELAILPGKNFL